VEILDTQGNPCAPGQEGTLRIRTDSQSLGYDNSSPAASSAPRDGWFYPGDLARITDDGILIVTGRSTQLINAGGVKLAPELIEELLLTHPDVADAGACGIVSQTGVEEIWVAIVSRRELAAQAIVDHCRQRNPNMTPRQVKFAASIPRNAMGKIAREALKQLLTSTP
jgi:acyl-coenzyme A synthetase/AMP-(fatty) acid ligase